MKAKHFVHIPPNPPPTPPPSALPPPSGQPAGPRPTEPGSNLPIRWGKPRSFWAILGLSIITCTIYYIVYHYLVASELKKTMRWSEDESYKPTTYMILYTAIVVYTLLMFTIITIALAYLGIEAGFNKLVSLTSGSLQLYFVALQIVISGVGYYITYYFLKLNDNAAPKVGVTRRGAARATLIYGFVTGFGILMVVVGAVANTQPHQFGELGAGGAVLMKNLALVLFNGFLYFLLLATAIYFLWEQTELVNYVWEKGRFAAPPGYTSPAPTTPLAAGYTPNPAPGPQTAPVPPPAPPPPTAPDQPSKRPDAENPTSGSGPQTPPPPPVSD